MEVLVIGGKDYTRYIQRKGISWQRDDLDVPTSGRTLDGVMHRAKVAEKRTLKYKLMSVPQSDLAALDSALQQQEFDATYMDLHGIMTKRFYCSAFSASLDEIHGEQGEWSDATFNIHEI